jgi:hypothetical protein
MSIDDVPYEIISMIYRMCDSVSKLKLFVSYRRIMKIGLRPPVLQNVLISVIENNGNLSRWTRKIDDPLSLFHTAVKSNNLAVLPVLKPYLKKLDFHLRDFRYSKQVNLDFIKWAAKNGIYIDRIKNPDVLKIYSEHTRKPDIRVFDYSGILDRQILDNLWDASDRSFCHRIWKIRDACTYYEVTEDVHNWLDFRKFPYMEKFCVADEPYRSISQQILNLSGEFGNDLLYDASGLEWVLYRFDHEEKFMRLASLATLQKAWSKDLAIPYREDVYNWAIQTGVMYWNDPDYVEQIIGYGTDEMFQDLLSRRKPTVVEMIKWAKLPRLLAYLKTSGIVLNAIHIEDLDITNGLTDPEVLVWLYKNKIFSIDDTVEYSFQFPDLLSDMVRRELLSYDNIIEIIEMLSSCIYQDLSPENIPLFKKILKRGYRVDFVNFERITTGILSQLAERNRRWPRVASNS